MIYRFGEYEIDAATFELRRNGEHVPIEPQVFSVLVHLIENRERVVSKDDLINAIWGGRAISDTTLSSRIFAMRRAVGDTGEAQSVIKTVLRRGFRFVADITQDTDDSSHAPRPNGAMAGINLATSPTLSDPALPNSDKLQTTAIPTIAVLPFKNASADLDEYICDGLTEDLTSNLTHFSEIRVIASGSSLQFKNHALSIGEIAAKLNADYIVEGSVRGYANRLRVTAQLVDAATGVSIWADRYDREMADIFAVQDAVTHMIVASLGVTLQSAALTRALGKSPTEIDAYDCLLRARRYTTTLNEDMHAEARDLLEQAIALDPNYADAFALLANVYLAEHRFDANPRPNTVGRALEMALIATRLDPKNAYAHCWLAIVHFFLGDNDKFKAETRIALDLNPHDPEILADVGHYLSFMGEFERGIELSKQAQQLNPLHPGWYHFGLARYHFNKRDYEKTLVDVQRIGMPEFYWTHLLDAAAHGHLSSDAANTSLQHVLALKPGLSPAAELKKWNVAPDDFEHIMDGLRKAGLKD